MALFAFDGTWQDSARDETARWTNVTRFKDLYEQRLAQEVFYWGGVGTRLGQVGKYVGGGLGIGSERRVHEALACAVAAHANGDEAIDIVGFSRGSAIACAFAWALFRWGLRDTSTVKSRSKSAYRLGTQVKAQPAIRFVGLFDTVFATEDLLTSMPFLEAQRTKGLLDDKGMAWMDRFLPGVRRDFHLPGNVAAAAHALAIHERRIAFKATRVGNAYETWFPGVHGDIGGGGSRHAISDSTLRWMLARARLAGLAFAVGDGPDSNAMQPPEDLLADTQPLFRTLRAGDRLHPSAIGLTPGIQPKGFAVEDA